MTLSSAAVTAAQLVAILLTSLLLGTIFGIWRGYDPAGYSPPTFTAVHQGAVRGLNVILPAFGLATLVLIAGLGVVSRDRPGVLWLYVLAFFILGVGALVTRFGNQPINDLIMQWSPANMPADWAVLRDKWWSLHLIRLAAAFAGEVLLLGAVFADRTA